MQIYHIGARVSRTKSDYFRRDRGGGLDRCPPLAWLDVVFPCGGVPKTDALPSAGSQRSGRNQRSPPDGTLSYHNIVPIIYNK